MALNLHSSHNEDDDDYIDMEVSSYKFLSHSMTSPPHPREFEFQMSSISLQREPTTSPADELFYKGKLLPLHLPPRIQMVEKLLQNSNPLYHHQEDTDNFEEFYSTPLTTTTTTPTTSTPFESCNISPSESCRISRELNPDEYFFEYSTELVSGYLAEHPKRSWTKKLKLIKHNSFSQKLKASKAYLKGLFGKSSCSEESCAAAARNVDEGSVAKAKYMKATKIIPFQKIQRDAVMNSTFDKENISTRDGNQHRRSFSGAIKRNLTTKCSSSSSSSSGYSCTSNLNGFHRELQFFKRSSSSNSEIESSIQGAIAHCKKSQQVFRSRKTLSEVGFCSFSDSRITLYEDQERPGLCRG